MSADEPISRRYSGFMVSALPPLGAQMSSTGRGAIRGTRSTSLGGGYLVGEQQEAGVLGEQRLEAKDQLRVGQLHELLAQRTGAGALRDHGG